MPVDFRLRISLLVGSCPVVLFGSPGDRKARANESSGPKYRHRLFPLGGGQMGPGNVHRGRLQKLNGCP
jgi:hypothetical protein